MHGMVYTHNENPMKDFYFYFYNFIVPKMGNERFESQISSQNTSNLPIELQDF